MSALGIPTIRIDGRPLGVAWSLTRQAALAGLKITWGRDKHQDQIYPAQLQLSVIDTDGHLARSAEMVGQEITVTRSDGRIIFRGRLDDFKIVFTKMRDKDTNEVRRVWRLELSAACKVAELARATLPGPENMPAEVAGQPDAAEAVRELFLRFFGPRWWWIQKPSERISAIMAQGANEIVAGIDWTNPYPVEDQYPYVRFHAFSEKFTALDLIEGLYSAHPLGYVNYVPATNRVTLGQPATTDGLALNWDHHTLTLSVLDGYAVAASTVVVPQGYAAETGIAEAIDMVQIGAPETQINSSKDNYDISTTDVVLEHRTQRFAQAQTGLNEFSRHNDVLYSIRTAKQQEVAYQEQFEWPASLAIVDPDNEFHSAERPTHEGIDFPLSQGTPITAMGDGIVILSEYHTGWGNHVRIHHDKVPVRPELITLYAHMVELGVPVGTRVKRGDTIGYVGNTGNSFGAHLHLETWVDRDAVNPRDFMQAFAVMPGVQEPAEEVTEGVWHQRLAEDTAALFDQLNGLVKLPTVRLDWRIRSYSAGVADAFIDTYAKDMPLSFTGSVFNVIPDAATVHQIIGGTLTYEKGWSLDANVVPAIHRRGRLTFDQMFTNPEPTFDDFDPAIRFADLGDVTRGV